MNHLIIILVAASLTLVGCKKKTESGTPATTNAAAVGEAAAQPLPPPPPHVAAVAENVPRENAVGEVNAFLTEQLRIFVREKRRLPNSFAEFASTRLDSVPGAPAGKKWVIDATTQQVKAVAAQ